RRIELTDFTAAEAAPLAARLEARSSKLEARRPSSEASSTTSEQRSSEPRPSFAGCPASRASSFLLQRGLYWTGGQPYLTQRLCRATAEDGHAASPADVDRLCEGLFLTRHAQEVDDNLVFVRNRLLRSEVELAGLLDTYRKVQRGRRVADDETNVLASVLR